jgi:aspartate carbamoyltransferase regulatory subunit
LSQVKSFVVKLPPEAAPLIRRALNSLGDQYSVKIDLETQDLLEFSSSSPSHALLRIALLYPSAVIRERINGMEQEVSDGFPEWVEDMFTCSNKNCITAQPKEPTKPRFQIVSVNPPKILCYYCGRYVDQGALVSQISQDSGL